MALWDSADLVRRAKVRVNRPATDEAFTVTSTDDVWYDYATEAQDRVNTLLGIFVPDAVWTIPTALTSSDAGLTYGFGNDADGAAIFAFGHFRIYASRSDIPDNPLVEGVDFLVENTKLRMLPNNVARTFSDGGPWAQYAAPSNAIASATQPTIPKIARKLLITDMVRRAKDERLGLDSIGDEAEFQREWLDLLALIRTQGAGKGGRNTSQRPPRFWRTRRF